VLAELDKMDIDQERYAAKVHVVRESVEMHIAEEEEKLLPRLEKLLDDEERKEMGEAMLLMKQAAPNHPHPGAPDEPPGSLVAAMLAKMTDTGKDLVRKLTNGDKAEGHRRVTQRARATAGAMASKRSRQGSGANKRGAAAH
jgi:hypothetical protein